MSWLKTIGIAAIIAAGTIAVSSATTQAVQLSDGTVFFERVPRLLNASLTKKSVAVGYVRYYFDLSVPSDAGEPLQRIDIAQREGRVFTQEVDFDLEDSQAFIGRRRDRGEELNISNVSLDEETRTVSVMFDPPIPPGTDLTVRLRARRNPRRSGVYLFGVTAYPQGEQAHGQFLGFGRFHIFDNGNNSFVVR